MKKSLYTVLFLLTLILAPNTEGVAQSATKAITLEDIWQKGTFRTKGVPGFNFLKDGKHYATSTGKAIVKNDLTTGQAVGNIYEGNTPFDDYTFSGDESKILFATESEQIYRRSSKSFFQIWDGKTMTALYSNAKQNNPTFNAQGTYIAFTSDNNLYIKDLQKNKLIQATKDGAKNRIINGFCDWVYEEEFSFTRAYEWSPDGSKIAFLRFDESNVPQFNMEYYNDGTYPTPYTFKYPKVGENNSVVTVWLFDVKKGKAQKIETGNAEYFPRLKWTPDNKLIVFKMNRLQNELELLQVNPKTAKVETTLLKETRPTYVDLELNDDLTFLKDGSFVKTSEQDGFNHIYLYDKNGKIIRQLTKGNWDVRKMYGVDEPRGEVFYQGSKITPMQKEVYFAKLDGSKDHALGETVGSNDAQFSSTFDYFVLNHSTANTPPTYTVYDSQGKSIRLIENNEKASQVQQSYGASKVDFFSFKNTEGVSLNGWMIKPTDFDASKKYPVFMFQYSGPGSQQVLDQWNSSNYWWFQMLAQKGYIIACIDPRGTGGRGETFKKMTYKQLGHYETIDQIEAAKWLGQQTYVDAKRIGIFGWSYGGYMSSLCILKGNDVFKSAIAVAPVTNWKWYDSIYTERFMQTGKENAQGYKDNSPVYFADRLKGNYLLVHGMADDNVHFQNSIEMVEALIKANKQFDTYYYPNRNHGIYGGFARLHLYTKMTNFILEKL